MGLRQTLTCLALCGAAAPVWAVELLPQQWQTFDVDSFTATSGGVEWINIGSGAPLSFTFTTTQPALLRVVDGGFAGDTFTVILNGAAYATAAVPMTDIATPPLDAGLDFDLAWAQPQHFSGFSIWLSPGAHTLSGRLLQSVQAGGTDLNATVGAVVLTPVPEPSTLALTLCALGLMGLTLRWRTQG